MLAFLLAKRSVWLSAVSVYKPMTRPSLSVSAPHYDGCIRECYIIVRNRRHFGVSTMRLCRGLKMAPHAAIALAIGSTRMRRPVKP